MTIERQNITDIIGPNFYIITTGESSGRGGWQLELRAVANDALVAIVDSDDLFDANGNRFHYDAE